MTTERLSSHASHGWAECVQPSDNGTTLTCSHIATQLVHAESDVRRVARLANRSPRHFARYSTELQVAKAHLASTRQRRDDHMAECPGAVDRFGA